MRCLSALCSLQITGRHLARLVVALEVIADFLSLDDFVHSRPFDGRDVHESVSTAIVRLDKAKALGGVEPFNCARGHDEPFQSNIVDRHVKAQR